MSTQPTPGALSAAKEIQQKINAACDRLGIQRGRDEAQLRGIVDMALIIDREAVKPATAELLAALKITVAELSTWEEEHGRAPSSVTESARAAIAKHEART